MIASASAGAPAALWQCHVSGSHAGRVVVTAGDRRMFAPHNRRPLTNDRQLTWWPYPKGRAPAAQRSRGRAQPLSQAKGQPPGSRAPVVGAELHMHPDVGVCSIGYGELTVVLLLRRQRRHATPRAPNLWNGRDASASRRQTRASAARDDAEAGCAKDLPSFGRGNGGPPNRGPELRG